MYRLAILCIVPLCCSTAALAAGQPAVARPSEQQLQSLIQSLGDKQYLVRQKAEQDLERFGFQAIDALARAADSDDLEVVARAERLLRTIRSNWSEPDDPPDVVQALNEYEAQDDAGRESRIAALLGLNDHQGVPAVCKIIGYDRSIVVAKLAAVGLMQSLSGEAVRVLNKTRTEAKADPTPEPVQTKSLRPEVAAAIRKRLADCQRPPARWVLAWLSKSQDPPAVAAALSKVVDEDLDTLAHRPRETSAEVVEALLQLQIRALRSIQRESEAAEAVQRLMKLHHGEPAALARLLQWLIEQKNWPATRLVERQYGATIADSPELLYLVAEVQALRGDGTAAEQSAAAALKLNPETDDPTILLHFEMGQSLETRGRHDWAIREWEYVVRTAAPKSPMCVLATRYMSELYHDLEQDDRAAETLGRLEKAYAGRSPEWRLFSDDDSNTGDSYTVGMLRARRQYFEACRWRDQHDLAKERAALDAALATHAYDIEVLIECYRLPDAAADYRGRIRKLIEKKLREIREQVSDSGHNITAAQPCNEFAWLVSNTEGDLDEALEFSQRSLELSTDNGAFRDTLARVYYAKGNLDEALKHQTAAAAMLPYARAVQKQLVFLRGKVAEKKEKAKAEAQGAKPSPKQKSE